MSDAHILTVEVEGIQQWIVGNSTELRAIRGGSRSLDRAFSNLQQRLGCHLGEAPVASSPGPPRSGWSLPVASSGSLTAIIGPTVGGARLDTDAVVSLCSSSLARDLPTVQAKVGVAPWSDATTFPQARAAALATARPVRRHQVSRYVPGTLVCTSCGTASSSATPFAGVPDWHLCSACDDRVRSSDTQEPVEGTDVTYELRAIGAAVPSERWRGYVGIVSADGNAIGASFAGIGSPVELHRRSAAVKAAVDANLAAAFRAAVDDHRGITGGRTDVLPVNPLVRAGDDVRLVVPAHVALATAAALIDGAELTGCAGIVLAHATTPFSDLHDHAETLLTEAKSAARDIDPVTPPPMLRFAIESAARPRDLEVGDPTSAGAYPAAAVAALLETADRLKVSSHAVRRVAEAVRAGGRVADREWEIFLHRRCSDVERSSLAALWDALGGDVETSPTLPSGGSPVGDLQTMRSLRRTDRRRQP